MPSIESPGCRFRLSGTANAHHEDETRAMSGPNTQYDPVEVAALDPEAIDKAVQDALDAIAGAGDLEQLKSVRTADRKSAV